MEKSKVSSDYNKDVCDLRHESDEKDIAAVKDELEKVWKELDSITNPASGHIALLRKELEIKIDKQDSRLNGLIISIVTTIVSIAIGMGAKLFDIKIGK